MLLFRRVLFFQQRPGGGDGLGAVAAFVDNAALGQQHRVPQRCLLFQRHHRHALRVSRGLGQELRRGEDRRPAVGGVHRHLLVRIQRHHSNKRTSVAVGAGELLPVGFGLIGGQGNLRRLAVFKEEQNKALVVPAEHQRHQILSRLEAQLLGQVIAQLGRLAVVEVGKAGLVALIPVGEHQKFRPVGGLLGEGQAVALLEFLLAAHSQGLGGHFFQVALFGDEHRDAVVRHVVFFLGRGLLCVIENLRPPGLAKLVGHRLQLLDDDVFQLPGAVQRVSQIGDLPFQIVDGTGLLEDVFLVDVAQLDLRHIIRLNLVYAEADHQVGYDLAFQLRLPDDGNGLVDIQQNPLQTL